MTKPTFDIEAAMQALRDGKDLTGKDGILTPLIKQLTEAMMQGELDRHLAAEETPNRKSGTIRKTMKSAAGNFELDTPRDRAGTFEPQIVKKHQTHLTDELNVKSLRCLLWAQATRSFACTLRICTVSSSRMAPLTPLPTSCCPSYKHGASVIWMRSIR